MKLEAMITDVMNKKPSQFDWADFVRWTSNLEKKIHTDIFLTHEDPPTEEFTRYYEDDNEEELLLPDEYCDVYKYYLYAMIDFENQESDRYAASSTLFNQSYQEFVQHWNRTHRIIPTRLKLW